MGHTCGLSESYGCPLHVVVEGKGPDRPQWNYMAMRKWGAVAIARARRLIFSICAFTDLV